MVEEIVKRYIYIYIDTDVGSAFQIKVFLLTESGKKVLDALGTPPMSAGENCRLFLSQNFT